MSEKTFRPWEIDQTWLFPPSVRDFVPEGHIAEVIREVVRTELDLSAAATWRRVGALMGARAQQAVTRAARAP